MVNFSHVKFVYIPTGLILHILNYMIITYFNIQSWDKDHSTQHEMAIPLMYRFIQKYKG